jgi:hypothetical protein
MRFQVLTAVSMKIKVFWDVAPCGLFGVDRRFGRKGVLPPSSGRFIALMM